MDSLNVEAAVRIVRVLVSNGINRETALANPAIPEDLRSSVREALEREDTIVLHPARVITA